MNSQVLLALGLIAQGLFASRFLVQLVKSEKANKVVSPTLFWQLSLIASFLLITYGFFRNDIVIVGGQLVGYLIYIRNLQLKGEWIKIPKMIRLFAFLLPFLLLLFLIFGLDYDWNGLIDNPEIEGFLLTWGTLGQLIFTSRFVVQWVYSEKLKDSVFPVSFWYISTLGALLIASYAIMRNDAVLFIGQGFGLIVYLRNLYLHHKTSFGRSKSLFLKFKPYRFPALMIFTAIVLFFNLDNWTVTESSEARYAQIGKEMVESGDYLHPTLMGIYHYHKPPMTYWITAVSYKIFGVSSWSARFFLQVALLAMLFLVYRIGLVYFSDDKKAFYSSMIFAAFPTYIIAGRALTTDAYLVVFVLLAVYFWLKYLENYKSFFLLLSYFMLGLGFLTKGPVVLIVPVILTLFSKFYLKEKQGPWSVHILGFGIFLTLGLSWFVFLFLEDPQFLDYFVFKHTVQRFATDTFSRSQPVWFYPALLIGTAFPWILILGFNFKRIWKSKDTQVMFLMAWIIVPLLFFSISKSKLILYILPIYPGIALAAAKVWLGLDEKSHKKWDRIQFGFHVLILIGLAISPLIDSNIVLNYKFFFILVITASLLVSLRATSLKVVDRTVFTAYLFVMGVTASSSYFFGSNPGLMNDQKRIAAFIEAEIQGSENILVYDKRMPSMSFLTEKNIISLYDGDEGLNREVQFEKGIAWKSNLINLQDEPDWLIKNSPKNSVMMVKKNKLKKLGSVHLVFENSIEIDGWILYY
ncbi:Polymyxin resistance protein ArnT, undecaprenyl phosphate-alpha-L-Ara4N transferase [Indibacter alkaliphilus LW1]|uniref:Polymyxin resistance protein ArnT, undecaprenyl phosphate-alpha-L-Ara4N transferase n=1 Tax=Indibacter alkaliphilus (strain CCUG 57479 / KCTC 22604 / LW1) TaxID=1189612 RepID=S2D7M8_INDAL|nr:lipid-A-disaccharide synthase N-terminal domain-containing protein [Indibacter alkaliphilus]EOZ95232.1 Polymyxin resistance protein ArnT, undecaprenyl phosphate-alpha-L-Ara4N transferase [Indibacter alkaliphilus LW1]